MTLKNFIDRMRKRILDRREQQKPRSSGRLRVTRLEDRKLLDASFGVNVDGILSLGGFDAGDSLTADGDLTGGNGVFELTSGIWEAPALGSGFTLSNSDRTLTVSLGAASISALSIDGSATAAGQLANLNSSTGLTVGNLNVADVDDVDFSNAGNDVVGSLSVTNVSSLSLTDGNDVSIAALSASGDVTISSVAGDITDADGTTIGVGGNAEFDAANITLGDHATDTTDFGSLTFDSAGSVNITEDSATELARDNDAGTLSLTSSGTLTNADGTTLDVTNDADLEADSIDLRNNTGGRTVNFGSVQFSAQGDVVLHENTGLHISADSGSVSGDVTLNADGDLSMASGVTLSGDDIDLTSIETSSDFGNIGSSGDAFTVDGATLKTFSSGDQVLAVVGDINSFDLDSIDNVDLVTGKDAAGTTGAVTLQSGTLNLDAPHNVVGDLTIASGATLSGTGVISNLTVATGGTLDFDISGLVADTQYDQLKVNGNVVLGGTLTINETITPAHDAEFTIVNNTAIADGMGGGTTTGTFAGLAEGGTVFGENGHRFSITYAGGDGNDVVLKALTPVYSLATTPAMYTYNENSGSGNATITVERSGDLSIATSVAVNVSAGSATADVDFTAGLQTVEFDVGETSKTFDVAIVNDAIVEADETIQITLVPPKSGALLGTNSTGTLTVVNDDIATLTIADNLTINEADGTATFTITSTAASQEDVSVSVALNHGTTSASDVALSTATATINGDGTSTSTTVTVSLTDDQRLEGSESFSIGLSNALFDGSAAGTRVVLGDATAAGTIADNETATLSFSAASSDVDENSTTHDVRSTLTLSTSGTGTAGLDRAVSFDVAVTGGTATDVGTNADYSYTTKSVTFAAGSDGTVFNDDATITLHEDVLNDDSETIQLSLNAITDGSGGQLSTGTTLHTITINDDDTATSGTIDLQAGAGDVVVLANGGNVEIWVAGNLVATRAVAGFESLVINGTASDEMVTIDTSAATFNTAIEFNGGAGADTLRIINPTTGVHNATGGITFHGNAGDDTLELLGGTAASVEHRFVNNSDGSVLIDGATAVTYTGLAPIVDTITATTRVFSFTGGAETITLSDDGTAGDNMSLIDSTLGESVTFLTASDAVTINTEASGGTGADLVQVRGVDSAWTADLIINAGNDDTVTFDTTGTTISSGDLSVTANNINVNAALAVSNGSLTMDSNSALATTAAISASGGTTSITAGTTAVLNGTIDGTNDLTLNVTGSTTFAAAVGATTVVGDGTGAALTINSTGATVFQSTVRTANGIVQNNAAGTVTFQQNVTTTGGQQASTFNGNVILDGLTFSSDGDIVFGNAATDTVSTSSANAVISTTNNDRVTFNAATSLGSDLTINSGSGAIDLNGTINGPRSLNLNSTGATSLNAAIGSATALASITTNAGGTTTINGTAVTTSGNQTYNDSVTLGGDTVLTAATVQNVGTIAGGGHALAIVGNANIDAAVSGLTTFSVSGNTNLGANVTSSAAQQYAGPVTISADVTTTGVGLSFDSTVDGAFRLTADGGTGTVAFSGTVGGINRLSGLIVDGANVDFDGAVAVDDEGLDVDATGLVSFDAAVSTTNGGTVTLSNGGVLTLAAAADFTIDGAFVQDGAGAVSTAADIVTTGDLITFATAVTQTGSVLLDTTNSGGTSAGANITLNTVAGGGNSLTLNAGSGGAISSGSIANVATLTISDSNTSQFSGAVSATTVAIGDTTTVVTFDAAVTATNFTAAAAAYGMTFNAGGSVTNAVTFNNTGGVTFGNDTADMMNFAGGVTSTASATTIQGTLNTTSSNVTFGQTTLAAATTINTGAAGGTITTGQISGSGVALTLNAGTGDVLLANSANVIGDLIVNAAAVTITEADAITQAAAWTTTGTTNLAAGTDDITLNNAGNQFGTLNLTSANATIRENTDLTVGSAVVSSAIVLTSAGSINDASNDSVVDITAATIDLNAATGIGNVEELEIATASVSADTTTGDIDIDNALATATDVSSLVSGNGDINFDQSGGGDVTFSGPVSSGGGAITLSSANELTVNAAVSSTAGTGGTLAIGGATIGASVTVGAGNVSIQGGGVDLKINANLVSDNDIALTAERDVIIAAAVNANSGSDLTITADTNSATDVGSGASGGHGGVQVSAAGQLNAAGDITIVGSDVFATAGDVDSVLIDADGANTQVLAGGQITIAGGSNAPSGAAVVINGAVRSTGAGSAVDISSAGNVEFGSFGDVSTNNAAISITADTEAGANGGQVAMADGAQISAGAAAITVIADGNVSIGQLNTSTAVTVTSASGSIVDLGNTHVDIIAASASLNAASGIGSGNALETTVSSLAFNNATSGDVQIVNSQDLTIAAVGSLTTSNNAGGNIDLLTTGHDLTVATSLTAAASGNIHLTTSTSGDVILAGVVTATGDTVTIDSANKIIGDTSNTAADIVANSVILNAVNGIGTGSGNAIETTTNSLTATNTTAGDINMINSQSLSVGDVSNTVGSVELCVSAGNLTLTGLLNAGTNTVRLQADAGSVLESGAGRVTAGDLGVRAQNDVTLSSNANNVNTLAATATTGHVIFNEADGFSVGTVSAGDCFAEVVGVTTPGNGNITLQALTGALQIDSAVTSNTGEIDIDADAAAVTINASVSSTSGGIDITADVVNQNANITTGGTGTIDVTADNGNITMLDGSTSTSNSGAISYDATTDVALSQLNSAAGPVNVTATSGHILDISAADGAGNENVRATTATLTASGNIGGSEDLDTAVATLNASSTTAGRINIAETDGINLANVVAADGPVSVVAGGQVTATNVQSSTDAEANDISLTSTGAGIEVVAVNAGTGNAADVILDAQAGNITNSGSNPDLVADNLNATASGSIALDTTINTLTAESTAAGNITLTETDAMTLDSVTTADGAIAVSAGAGIVATSVDANGGAGDNVSLTATTGDVTATSVAAADSVSLNANAGNVIATSVTADTGNIDIAAATDVTATSVTATAGAVNINATTGDVNIELITANGPATPAVAVDIFAGHDIVDLNGAALNIQAASGVTRLEAGNDIGAPSTAVFKPTVSDPLEIRSAEVEIVAARNIAVHETGSGVVTILTADTAFLTSAGDLDLSGGTITTDNLSLVVAGQLTLPPVATPLSVLGDLRIEAGDVAASGGGGIELNADRLLFKSGQSEEINVTVNAVDGETNGDLTVNSDSDMVLTDLDCDLTAIDVGSNMAVLNSTTASDISQVLPSNPSENSRILAGSLALNGQGTFDLTNVDNNVNVLAGNTTGDITYRDLDDITVDTVNIVTNTPSTVNGLSSGGDIQIDAGTTLTINQQLSAASGDIRLQSRGNLIQSETGIITANQLGIHQLAAAGVIQLAAQNDVDVFAADNAAAGAAITFADRNEVAVGEVSPSEISDSNFQIVTGIHTNNGNITIDTGAPTSGTDSILLTQEVHSGTAAVRLIADGNVSQTADGTITANELGVRQQATSGDIVLDDANTVHKLATDNAAAGGLTAFRNTQSLLVETVAALNVDAAPTSNAVQFLETSGIVTNNGDVLIDVDGTLTFNQQLNAGTADARILTDGTVTQSADGRIIANELGIQQQAATGDIALGAAGNDVDIIAAENVSVGGDIIFFDADNLTISEVVDQTIGNLAFSTTTGADTNAGDINITSDGDLTVEENINAAHETITTSIDESITLISRNGNFTLADGTIITSDENPAVGIFDDNTRDSVTIIAGSSGSNGTVNLGSNIEVRTDGGVAKQVAPRPTAFATAGSVNNAAFVSLADAESSRANLTFIPAGFLGVLDLVIGVAGEENLEIVIDWGAISQTNLSEFGPAGNAAASTGTPGALEFSLADGNKSIFYIDEGGQQYLIPHVYAVGDLVVTPNDRNGREINPSIFGVRFSVAQHSSINIWGSDAIDPTTGTADTAPVDFSGSSPTLTDANGQLINPAATSLALLSSTDTNNLNDFTQQAADLPLSNSDVTTTGRPVGQAEWEFVAGPSPGLVLIQPSARPTLEIPRIEAPVYSPVISEIIGTIDFGTGASSDAAIGTEVYLQIRRFFELDADAEVVIPRITDSQFISNRESFEAFVEENPDLQDGAGYEVWLITETSGQRVERPIVKFEITGGRPGPATEVLPDTFEPYELKELEFEQPVEEDSVPADSGAEENTTSAIVPDDGNPQADEVEPEPDNAANAAAAVVLLPAMTFTRAARWKRQQTQQQQQQQDNGLTRTARTLRRLRETT